MLHKLKIELVPIEQDGVHIFIKARINGKPARFLVDTGASRTVVDHARVLRFVPPEEAGFEKLEAFSAGLGTNTMESHTILLHSLSFGRLVLKNYKTAVLDLSHVNDSYKIMKMKKIDGVIGGDLLHRLKAVIDYRKGEIIFLGL
jgi:predicted aspartyl protease